jgi:hypothetical protein
MAPGAEKIAKETDPGIFTHVFNILGFFKFFRR